MTLAPDPAEVARIAAGLTAAQKRAVIAMSEQPQVAGRATFNANSAFRTILPGISVLRHCRRRGDTYALTPLGTAVRARLLSTTP